VTQDDTSASTGTHPSWCDKTNCAVADGWPYGFHQSASEVVPADPPGYVVAELHLVSTMRGLSPDALLMLELDFNAEAGRSDSALPYPLTLGQARQLHAALDKLLAASGF
jgi:hypothetical protein